MIRVFVTGGRDYEDVDRVNKTLDDLHRDLGIDILGHGACVSGGADELAEEWAKTREIDYRGYPAKWETQGKSAGPRRNKRALKDFKPDLVVAFPGGKGTENCVSLAESMQIKVLDLRLPKRIS